MESSNVSQSGHEDVSPDRVFDFEAASRSTPSPKEAQQLQQLREKLEKEVEEVCLCVSNTLAERYAPGALWYCGRVVAAVLVL